MFVYEINIWMDVYFVANVSFSKLLCMHFNFSMLESLLIHIFHIFPSSSRKKTSNNFFRRMVHNMLTLYEYVEKKDELCVKIFVYI